MCNISEKKIEKKNQEMKLIVDYLVVKSLSHMCHTTT